MTHHMFRSHKGNHIVALVLALSMAIWLVFPSQIALAEQPPPEFADDKIAPNDLKPNDLGKKSREDYEKNHPDERNKPWIDKYYLHGEKDVMHDTENRSKTAQKAARYQKPAADNEPGKDEQVEGGGIYKKETPKEDEKIVENVWRFVEDLLEPKSPQGAQSEDNKRTDTWKFDKFIGGKLDIGKPIGGNSFICVETAYFLASLLRELGYKVQYKNTWPSIGPNLWSAVQTAAINVWYGGQWHFYDAWRSIKNEDDYLKTFHDYEMLKRTIPLERPFPYKDPKDPTKNKKSSWGEHPEEGARGWEPYKKNLGRDGARAKSQGSSRMRVIDQYARKTGWPGVDANTWDPSSPTLREIPGSAYINPTNLIAPESMEVSNWTQLGEEILSLTFINTHPVVLTYSLEVTNPTNVTVDYRIQLEVDEVDRNITMINPATPILEGTLDALGAVNITLVFQVSAPKLTPPEPVQNLRVNVVNGIAYLTWSPSVGVCNYTVYRAKSIEVPQNTSGGELIGFQITSTSFAETLPPMGTYFYMVTANSEGGQSELHPNEGSVEALQLLPPAPVGGTTVPIDIVSVDKFGLLPLYIGLASTILVATVVTAVYVKRVKRRNKKQ